MNVFVNHTQNHKKILPREGFDNFERLGWNFIMFNPSHTLNPTALGGFFGALM